MKPPPVFHGMPGAGRKRALTLSHLETDFRDAQVIDFAGGFFVPFLTLAGHFWAAVAEALLVAETNVLHGKGIRGDRQPNMRRSSPSRRMY